MFEQRKRAIGMLTAGMSATECCSAFPTPRMDYKSTTEQISAGLERHGPTQIRQTV